MDFSDTRMQQLNSLQDQIKFKFSDIKLLNKALTHRSYANENSGH
jgi:dsRNA-specific ribonuclease